MGKELKFKFNLLELHFGSPHRQKYDLMSLTNGGWIHKQLSPYGTRYVVGTNLTHQVMDKRSIFQDDPQKGAMQIVDLNVKVLQVTFCAY